MNILGLGKNRELGRSATPNSTTVLGLRSALAGLVLLATTSAGCLKLSPPSRAEKMAKSVAADAGINDDKCKESLAKYTDRFISLCEDGAPDRCDVQSTDVSVGASVNEFKSSVGGVCREIKEVVKFRCVPLPLETGKKPCNAEIATR